MENNQIIGICLMLFGSILICISTWMHFHKPRKPWGYVDIIKKK